MKNFVILTDALSIIEENLCNDISQCEIADSCYCSLSNLQKLFRYVFHQSVGEYISKRRLTGAARDLKSTDLTVLDVAMKYRYNSAEVFTRAFTKLWHITPSRFRKEWSFSGICPKLDFEIDEGADNMKRKYDISELYDYLRSKENTYVIGFDLVALMPINENYGSEAGDKAIIECLRRIDNACEDGMLLFRIGGDEFAMVTGLEDKETANALVSGILSQNGNPIEHNGIEIPIAMRAGAFRFIGRRVCYGQLFTRLVDVSKPKSENYNINECYFAD